MPRKKPTKKNPSLRTAILFFVGVTLILISLGWQFYQSRVLSFNSPTNNYQTYNQPPLRNNAKIPQTISIPELEISQPIIESDIKNGVWEINDNGASHLRSSARPGENGNIIIYGHNKLKLFGKALALKKGDLIDITTNDGQIHTYQIFDTETVDPSDISVLNPTTEETLTFYTCTGFLDSKRFIIKAKPIH